MSITEINSDLLTKKEAASYIRVTERWMQRATTHGIPVIKIGKRLKRISTMSQENVADITTTLHETISGVRVVKAFSMEPYEADKFASQNQRFYKLVMA